jgi:aminoglycoside phosphotransferase (APT) family kinase protein
MSEADKPIVKSLSQDAFNKVYVISSPHGDFVMRVSLPVDPRFKTLSEVAVLEVLHKITSVPIPEVIGFDASTHNELGLEWILMKRVRGNPLSKVWGSMTRSTKYGLVG